MYRSLKLSRILLRKPRQANGNISLFLPTDEPLKPGGPIAVVWLRVAGNILSSSVLSFSRNCTGSFRLLNWQFSAHSHSFHRIPEN